MAMATIVVVTAPIMQLLMSSCDTGTRMDFLFPLSWLGLWTGTSAAGDVWWLDMVNQAAVVAANSTTVDVILSFV